MKDHPEAQDVLQNLGRKRLMEVRSVNKQFNLAEKLKNEKLNAAGGAGGNDFLKKVIMSGRMSAKGPAHRKPTMKKDAAASSAAAPLKSAMKQQSQSNSADSGGESSKEVTVKKKKVTNANFISSSVDDSSLRIVDFAALRRTQRNRIRRWDYKLP